MKYLGKMIFRIKKKHTYKRSERPYPRMSHLDLLSSL